MANDLVQSPPFLLRVLRALGLADIRDDTGDSVHVAGADFASGNPATPGYPTVNSLSTVGAFPYIKASMDAIAADLASLPLRVRVGQGSDATIIDDHPVLELLSRPSSRVSGDYLRRSITTDFVLCGDCYVLVSGRDRPEVLLRLHPNRTKIVPMSDGQVDYFEYTGYGRTERYEWSSVLHFRQTSFEDDPTGLYGNGAIRALAHDLTADRLASELAAESAKTGRPTTVFSPSDPQDVWSKSQMADMRRTFESQLKGTGGALFLGGAASLQSLQFTPRDLEYQELKKGVRESILAVFDTPPTRLGGSSVNYATAAEQSKHWWSGLRSKATIIDGQFSRLARMFPGFEDQDVRVFHDFSGVEALQESRNDRVNRVLTWVTMGVPLYDAATYEGFDDLPGMEPEVEAVDVPEGVDAPEASVPSDQPVSASALNGAQVASLIAILEQVSSGLLNEDSAVALIGAAFPTVSESEARRIVAGAQPLEPEQAERTRGLSDLTEPIQTGLKNKAKEHNEQMDEKGFASWRKTSARTLASVFERGVGAYETNPESVRPSVKSPEQWAYARVSSFLYALRNDEFRSGKHDQDLLPEEHPMSTKKKSVSRAYESIDFSVPKGVVAELRRGLDWHDLGLSGDGLTSATVSWARRMANGADISPDKARKMRAWFARHESDKAGEGFRPGEEGYPSAGRVAWALWGGDPARTWSSKLVRQMDKEDEEKGFDPFFTRSMITDEEEEKRSAVWESWVQRVHDTGTDKLADILRKALRASGARVAKRYADEVKRSAPGTVERQVTPTNEGFDRILDELAEAQILRSVVLEPMRDLFEDAVKEAFDTMPDNYVAALAPSRVDDAVNRQVGDLVSRVQPVTRQVVQETVLKGIEEGATINEIQASLMQSKAFNAPRALRIASTSVTRAVNSGSVAAYQAIADEGFPIRYAWLSAKDKFVRDDHKKLDNHPPIRPGESFKIGDLETTTPGGFGVASQDINCRCTVIPVFDDE